jgi:hypothetical protein
MCYWEMTAFPEINVRGAWAWLECFWVRSLSCSGEPLLLSVEHHRPIRTCRIYDLPSSDKCRTICLLKYQLCLPQPHEGTMRLMTFIRTFFLHYEVFSRKARAAITVAVPYAVCKQTGQLLPTRSALEHGAATSSTAVVRVERCCVCVGLERH